MPATPPAPIISADWQRDGFIIRRHVFQRDEIAALDVESRSLLGRVDLIHKQNLRCRYQAHVDNARCVFETFDPVIDIGPVCRRFAFDPRLLGILRDLYGDEPCLFKDKLIFKPPGALGYRLHQDWIAWPGFPRSFLTVLVPIDACDEHNGCTEVFAGCHQNGSLTAEDGEYHDVPPEVVEESRGVKLVLQPGDVAVFGGFTPHRSAPNRSPGWRRQLYLSYNAHSDGGDQRAAHYEQFHLYLRRRYAEHDLTETWFA
jgi:hypothetical protein